MRKMNEQQDAYRNPRFERRVMDVVERQAKALIQQVATSVIPAPVAAAAATSTVVARKTADKAVTNSVTETDLLNGEFTVAAGAMSTNKLVRVTAWGDFTNNSGAARDLPRFKVKLGATPTTVIDISPTAGSLNASASISKRGWKFVIEIMNKAATNSQTIWLGGDLQFVPAAALNSNFAAATGVGALNVVAGVGMYMVGNIATIDTTAAMSVQFAVINPTAVATYETALRGAIMELI